jgi:hypothetical protein
MELIENSEIGNGQRWTKTGKYAMIYTDMECSLRTVTNIWKEAQKDG